MPAATNEWWFDLLLSIAQGFLPGIVLVIVAVWQQRALNRHNAFLEQFRSAMESRGRFFERHLEATEELWVLLAKASRAQEELTAVKGTGVPLDDKAKAISEARRALKNHVYEHGLFFEKEVIERVQALDNSLADPKVLSVAADVIALQEKLRETVKRFLPQH